MSEFAPPADSSAPDASSSFLGEITSNNVIVKLNSGLEYHGKLQSVDGFMNIALEQTKELVDQKVTKVYGDVFIRGNNGKWRSEAEFIIDKLFVSN
jgi:U6 snRNA-associated Sm-like protein LSm6